MNTVIAVLCFAIAKHNTATTMFIILSTYSVNLIPRLVYMEFPHPLIPQPFTVIGHLICTQTGYTKSYAAIDTNHMGAFINIWPDSS